MILYDAFNFDTPKIIHLPHVVKEDGSKISKRNNDDNVKNLLDQGYLPQAIINYLALLGWNPKSNKEFFTLDELIKEFDIKNITKDPSHYDIKKLRWFNSHYIKELTDEEYLKFITPFFIKYCNMNGKSRDFINNLALLYKEHISYGMQIVELTKIFFEDYVDYKDECKNYLKNNLNVKNIVLTFKNEITKIGNWNITSINECLSNVENICNVSKKELYMPIRIAITGTMQGPDIVNTIYLIGKEKILNRLG
jgi:glutamyl/glutaminyl-tRNA synthetase